MFRHLTDCTAELSQAPTPALIYNITAISVEQLIIESSPAAQETTPFSSYTHLRIQAQSIQSSKGLDICADPGTGRSIVDREWLQTLEHTISKKKALTSEASETSI
jgi:hypothetical protein